MKRALFLTLKPAPPNVWLTGRGAMSVTRH
jgi:hypothetical protein